jgi:hypothetical protein
MQDQKGVTEGRSSFNRKPKKLLAGNISERNEHLSSSRGDFRRSFPILRNELSVSCCGCSTVNVSSLALKSKPKLAIVICARPLLFRQNLIDGLLAALQVNRSATSLTRHSPRSMTILVIDNKN